MGKTLSKYFFFTVCLLVSSTSGNLSQLCRSYGCPRQPVYEPFVPAPRGQTPRCARPGQTFCEAPDHYPQLLIKFLVDKCSYDFASILRDESSYDFQPMLSKPSFEQGGYDYPSGHQVPQFNPHQVLPGATPSVLPQYPVSQGQPAIVYGPPSNDTDQEGYNYHPPGRSQQNSYADAASLHNSQPSLRNFRSLGEYENLRIDSASREQGLWTNRFTRNVSNSTFRDGNLFLRYSNTKKNRDKRQSSSPDAVPLCPTDSRYISPRAALNSQGNWMYVVNLSGTREKYTQLVRSETCTTSECSRLCIPLSGYTSRCKQKYVQRRLVALEGTGDRLYTDLFWFPHGCSCEVSLEV